MSYNKIIMVGNLTRDIELRYAQSGSAIANTAIATTHKFTSNGERKEEVCYTDITFFGRSAEVANQYLRKGSKILIEGRLNFDQWVAQDGSKRSKHSIIVETMQMMDSKPQQEQAPQEDYRGNGPQQSNPTYGQQNHTAYQPKPQPQQNNYGKQQSWPAQPQEIDIDESIPF